MMQALAKLDQEVTRTLKLARDSFPSQVFPEPKIKMDLTGKVAGTYSPKENIINFNLSLMLENKEDFLKETVPHEVAHLVTRIIDPLGSPHGAVWKAIMRLFGIPNPQLYHSYKVAPVKRHEKPYIYCCSHKEHPFTKRKHNYAQSGINYICTTCHQTLHYSCYRATKGEK
jgi:SprT protein